MRAFEIVLQAHHCDYLLQILLPLMHYYVHEFKHNVKVWMVPFKFGDEAMFLPQMQVSTQIKWMAWY